MQQAYAQTVYEFCPIIADIIVVRKQYVIKNINLFDVNELEDLVKISINESRKINTQTTCKKIQQCETEKFKLLESKADPLFYNFCETEK